MTIRVEVTIRCINEYDDTGIYSCYATYSSKGNTLTQAKIDDSEVDNHTKAIASDALYMTHTFLRNQIKNNEFTEDAILKRAEVNE